MPEFERERLGLFRKVLSKIGKVFMWWRAPKSNIIILNGCFIFIPELFYQLTNDYAKANEEWFLVGIKMGRSLLNEMFDLIEIMVSKSVRELTYLVDAAWSTFMGRKPTYIQYFPPDEQGIEKISWAWDECIMCTNAAHLIGAENAKNLHTEALAAGVFQIVFQILMDYVGNSFKVEAKDTQSRARGDPTCELTLFFNPIERIK